MPSGLQIQLQPPAYRCAWVLAVSVHCLCAVFLTQLARVYHLLTHPFLETPARLSLNASYPFFENASVGVALLSAPHWWWLLDILWSSLRAKELSSFFSRRGVFGVESRVFHTVLTAREFVEAVSQSFQAKRSSEMLPRQWLNNLLVALVVTNCWSTPIVQLFLGRREGAEQVVCLLLDALLNIGSAMLIPLAIFLPYYRALSPATLSFPFTLVFDPVWSTRQVVESQFLFSLAIGDVLSKLVQHLGIFMSLTTAVELVQHRREEPVSATSAVHPSRHAPTPGKPALAKSAEAKTPPASARMKMTSARTNAKANSARAGIAHVRASSRRQLATHVFFFLWGFAVLVIHAFAARRNKQHVPGCGLVTNTWFTASYPCSVYNYNCYRHGTTSPDEDSWRQLDPGTLMFLAISHCSELKMPRRLQSFPNLLRLQLYNSTLVEWSNESAISATKHPRFAILDMARTNLTGIPDGMLGPLPANLQTVLITHTNLTALPIDLHVRWKKLEVLYIEHSLLRAFPTTLTSLPVRALSLHGNRIEALPELASTRHHYFFLTMSANPLKELPDAVAQGFAFSFFAAEQTLLRTVPTWMRSSAGSTAYLFGTPYCEALTTPEPACVVRDYRGEGKAPVGVVDTKYPL